MFLVTKYVANNTRLLITKTRDLFNITRVLFTSARFLRAKTYVIFTVRNKFLIQQICPHE